MNPSDAPRTSRHVYWAYTSGQSVAFPKCSSMLSPRPGMIAASVIEGDTVVFRLGQALAAVARDTCQCRT